MALPWPGSTRIGSSCSRSKIRIALGLLPAAHNRGRPFASLVQHMLFRLVGSSSCHGRRHSKGWVESFLVVHTASYD